MSQNFRYRYDEESDALPDSSPEEKTSDKYVRQSSARNICFVLADKKRVFLNYSYLVSGDYDPQNGNIILTFTSHIVTINGINLDIFFNELIDHIPRTVYCTNERYNMLDEENSTVINKIEIQKPE